MLKPYEKQQPLRTILAPFSDRMGVPWQLEELPDMHFQDAHKIVTEADEAAANKEDQKELPEVVEHACRLIRDSLHSI